MKYTSAIAATGSGSIGGATASHNRGGQYFRRRAIPVNPSTAAQAAIRGIFAALQAAWVTILTGAQRNAWDTYALNTPVTDSLGNSVNAGGKGMYTRGNTPRIQGSLTRVDAGPTTFGLPSLTEPGITSLVASSGVLTFTYTNTDTWATTTGGALMVYISRPVSAATNSFKGPFRFAGRILGNTGTPPTSPGTVTSPFTFAAGQKGFVHIEAVDSLGRLSGAYTFPVISS